MLIADIDVAQIATETGPLTLMIVLLGWLGKSYLDRKVAKPNGGESLRDHVDDAHTLMLARLDTLTDKVEDQGAERAKGDRRLHMRIDKLDDKMDAMNDHHHEEVADLRAGIARIEGRLTERDKKR